MAFLDNSKIEVIKNIAEIFALLIGGTWAVWLFLKKDEPTLAIREKTESTLKWTKPVDTNYVHAEFYVSLENTGTSVFSIDMARLRGWIFADTPFAPSQDMKYRDVYQIAAGHKPFFDTSFVENKVHDTLVGPPFIGKYVENSVWSDNFEFIMRPNPIHLVLFLMQFYQISRPFFLCKNDTVMLDWTYHWDYIGGLDSCKRK